MTPEANHPEAWPFVLGLLFYVAVLVLIVGTMSDWGRKL